MTTQAQDTSVQAEIVVEAPQERAFRVYWQIETDLDKTSEVEVRFIAESPERTRVELEHRNLDRHGDGWEGMREGVRGGDGWPLYLQRFAAATVEDG